MVKLTYKLCCVWEWEKEKKARKKVFGDLGQMSLVPGSLLLEINCIRVKRKTPKNLTFSTQQCIRICLHKLSVGYWRRFYATIFAADFYRLANAKECLYFTDQTAWRWDWAKSGTGENFQISSIFFNFGTLEKNFRWFFEKLKS